MLALEGSDPRIDNTRNSSVWNSGPIGPVNSWIRSSLGLSACANHFVPECVQHVISIIHIPLGRVAAPCQSAARATTSTFPLTTVWPLLVVTSPALSGSFLNITSETTGGVVSSASGRIPRASGASGFLLGYPSLFVIAKCRCDPTSK